jgi:hypothetical protein
VVQLAEGPGERCLAALIRPGRDEEAFGVIEAEIIGDNRSALAGELVRERQVEGSGNNRAISPTGRIRRAPSPLAI